jgi:hypothetical protein
MKVVILISLFISMTLRAAQGNATSVDEHQQNVADHLLLANIEFLPEILPDNLARRHNDAMNYRAFKVVGNVLNERVGDQIVVEKQKAVPTDFATLSGRGGVAGSRWNYRFSMCHVYYLINLIWKMP